MKVIGRTKNGWMVDATLDELNSITGLKVDKYGLGDQLEITPTLALAKDVVAKEAEVNKRIETAKAALASL